jgi:hypothetical protein
MTAGRGGDFLKVKAQAGTLGGPVHVLKGFTSKAAPSAAKRPLDPNGRRRLTFPCEDLTVPRRCRFVSTDRFGTQLDAPARWAQEYPAIDELAATYAIRPLMVMSILGQAARNPGYALQVSDIEPGSKAWQDRGGVTAHQLHRPPVFLSFLGIQRQPGQTLQLVRQVWKLAEGELAVVIAHGGTRAAAAAVREQSDVGWRRSPSLPLPGGSYHRPRG